VQEKTLARMTADAGTVMVAGTLTAWTLSLATYYLLSHPVVLRRLKEEIITAMPQGKTVTPADVENLPYLTAVVQECYRLSYGSSSRLQRPAPDEVLVYNDGTGAWTIPKGVCCCPRSKHVKVALTSSRHPSA
jgi:cytochrome P450